MSPSKTQRIPVTPSTGLTASMAGRWRLIPGLVALGALFIMPAHFPAGYPGLTIVLGGYALVSLLTPTPEPWR